MRRPVWASSSPPLHSVAERVNPRKARPPAPHGPRVLVSVGRPHFAAGRRVHDSGPQQEPEHRVLRSFPPSGTCAMAPQLGAELRIVAAEACGTVFRAIGGRTASGGTPAHGGLSLRPNGARRGKIPCAPPRCISAHKFCRRQGAQDFDERPPKISVRKFSKRARP